MMELPDVTNTVMQAFRIIAGALVLTQVTKLIFLTKIKYICVCVLYIYTWNIYTVRFDKA